MQIVSSWTALRWQGMLFNALADLDAHIPAFFCAAFNAACTDAIAIRAVQSPVIPRTRGAWMERAFLTRAALTILLSQFSLPSRTGATPWGAISQTAARGAPVPGKARLSPSPPIWFRVSCRSPRPAQTARYQSTPTIAATLPASASSARSANSSNSTVLPHAKTRPPAASKVSSISSLSAYD